MTIILFFQHLRQPPKLLSHSGIDNYRSGIKRFFQLSRRCADGWGETNDPPGNPVQSKEVSDYMTSIKKEDAQGTETKRSLPMTYERMASIQQYLESEESSSVYCKLEALQIAAIFTLSFVCMLRIDETLSLKFGDVDFSKNAAPESIPFITVRLIFRKTNQSNELGGSTYKLYSDNDESYIDARLRLTLYYEELQRVGGLNINPSTYLFPRIQSESVHPTSKTLASRITACLEQLNQACHLSNGHAGAFQTHCFRRGGAQYRFFYALKPWPLNIIKRWAGWAEGEDAGTLAKYLLEEYSRLEGDVSDMLSPHRRDRNVPLTHRSSDATDTPASRRDLEQVVQGQHSSLTAWMQRELARFLAKIEENFLLERSQSTVPSDVQMNHETVTANEVQEVGAQARQLRTTQRMSTRTERTPQALTMPTVIGIEKADTLEEVLLQWNGDPSNPGLKALKDWSVEERNPPEWVTYLGNNPLEKERLRKCLQKRKTLFSRRKLVGEAHARLGDVEFRRRFSDQINQGICALEAAIRHQPQES
jgi:hypothetical protein